MTPAPPGLPGFLIIGAAKAGTSWLVSCLRRHPAVFIPLEEIHYWTEHRRELEPSHRWYRRQFRNAAPGQLIGDNSNSYLSQPDASALIARDLPDVKLVAMLRNPVDRAYSGYCMRLRYGDVSDDVSLYLDPERTPIRNMLENSRYWQKLQPYIARFGRDRMHFVIHDDIQDAPGELLDGLCEFLDIEPRADEMLIESKVNAKEQTWPSAKLTRFFKRYPLLTELRRALKGWWLYDRMRGRFMRPVTYPPLPEELGARLRLYFADDVARLSEVVGRDLTFWTGTNVEGSPKWRNHDVDRDG